MSVQPTMEFSVYFFSANDHYDFGERYRFILDVARFIDDHGFAAIWTPERHFQEFGGSFPNPSVLSAAIAVITERIQLRAGSVVLPHHHPVRVVEEWSLVDQLSGGRAGVCLATGWHRGDFVFFPDHYERRREVTLDGIDTLRALWRGDAVQCLGPGGQSLEVRTYPRPVQPELPLWLVHTSNPKTWVAAGSRGLGVLTLLDSWERLADNIARYRDARAAAGMDPDGGTITVGLHTFIGDDQDEVHALVRDPVRAYLSSFISQKRGDAAIASSAPPITDEERELLAATAAEDFYQRRSLLGTPERCEAIVRRLAELGVDEIACLLDFGLPFETVLASLPMLDELRSRFAVPASAQAGAAPMSWYYDR